MKQFDSFFLMNTEDVRRYAVEVLHFFASGEETGKTPYYNEAKMSPTSIGGGKAKITGGEHISRLVETPTEVVLPVAKPEQRRYSADFQKAGTSFWRLRPFLAPVPTA